MRAYDQPVPLVLSAAFMLAAGIAPRVAAQSVQGRLTEQGSGKPVATATVILLSDAKVPSGQSTTSDTDGRFVLRAPALGIYRVRIDEPGYLSAVTPAFELETVEPVGIAVRLLPDTAQLRPMTITANRPSSNRVSTTSFRARRPTAAGAFFTRDRIEKAVNVSDLLATAPGITLVPHPRGFGYDVRTTEGCRPQVYLDGLRFPLMGETIDQIVTPSQLDAIEVYPHAVDVPIEFQTPSSSCGAILLWTRK